MRVNPSLPRGWCRAGLVLAGVLPVVLVLLVAAAPAGAHPLGNVTVNHSVGVEVAPGALRVAYVLDLAELPTVTERGAVDAVGLGAYGPQRCAGLARGLRVALDGEALDLAVATSSAALVPGQGGLDTLRVECRLGAALSLGDGPHRLEVVDGNEPGRLGWRELWARGHGVEVTGDLPVASPTAGLTRYDPAALLLDVRRADVGLQATDLGAVLPTGDDLDGDAARVPADDPFTRLIARGDGGVVAALVALAVAAGLGALHGLAPGHGKTVVAAYLVGTRGDRRQAAALALAVALSHTLGVFLLGGVTLVASTAFPLDRVYGWLQLVSALILLGLGGWLAVALLRGRRAARQRAALVVSSAAPAEAPARVLAGVGAGSHVHHRHGHHHDHAHPHGHDHHALDHHHDHHDGDDHHGHHHHDHDHHDGDDHHDHGHHDHGHHDGDDHHGHDHHDHGHHDGDDHHAHDGHGHHDGDGHTPEDRRPRQQAHRHGLLPHRHVSWDGCELQGRLGWRQLAALGLSGGMVPSASAVIVLLGAVQLGRVPFGAGLILAFGFGLAAALVGVGLGALVLSRRAQRLLDARQLGERVSNALAPAATVALLVVGAWLTWRAIGRLG